MKKLLPFTMFIIFVLMLSNANAKILRVGYFGTQLTGIDFRDLGSAHNAAAAGDTILIFPGSYNATLSKRLVIIGYGYLVTGAGSNADLQATKGTLVIGITLGGGSDSTILEGLDGMSAYASPNVSHSNITIYRCNGNVTFTNTQITNWQIKQSNISGFSTGYPYGGTVFTGFFVENCIVGSLDLHYMNASSTGTFVNNVIGGINFNNGIYSLINNIFLDNKVPANSSNCTFYNNIASNNIIPADGNNKPNVDLSTVFLGYPTQGTYSNDGRWQLKAGSPATGAGAIGSKSTDCGAFGGPNPYRPSGIPAIPSFYKISGVPITDSNPFNITFSVRSNN